MQKHYVQPEDPKEMDLKEDQISIQLRPYNGKDGALGADYWPLVTFKGVEGFEISQEGNTTTIKIRSPESSVRAENWERPSNYGRFRHLQNGATPG